MSWDMRKVRRCADRLITNLSSPLAWSTIGSESAPYMAVLFLF